MLARVVIAVLHEAWELIRKRLSAARLAGNISFYLIRVGKPPSPVLKKIFGGSIILNKLRNNYVFHHPYDADVEAAFEVSPQAIPLGMASG